MGHETTERGSGLAVVVVIAVLLGFFALLCVGTGALLLFGVRSAAPIRPVRAQPVPAPVLGTIPDAAYDQPDVKMAPEALGQTISASLSEDGSIRIDKTEVSLDQLSAHLRDLAQSDGGLAYLFLDVQVAPECRAEALIDFLDRVRRLEFCEVELSVQGRPR